MGIETRLALKQTQRLIMTPMLQQAIKLLPLQRLELISMIKNELTENPFLEETVEERDSEEDEKKQVESPMSFEEQSKTNSNETSDMDWETYFGQTVYQGMPTDYVEKPSFETFLKNKISIGEHLAWQLGLSHANDYERFIGTIIIGNINDDGYLETDLNEISQVTSAPIEDVKRVLSIIQTFDPSGIGATNIQECLLIQARNLEECNPLLETLINNHLNTLDENSFLRLAKELGVTHQEIAAAVKIIREMNPKPGNSIKESDIQYITPDVYIFKSDEDYKVLLNDDGIPALQINSFYQQALHDSDSPGSPTRVYLEEKYKSAKWLMKSIEQRRLTLFKVSESIVKFQKDFFNFGLGHLKPLILKDVANDISMHESTVSRVTTNKYILTPQGIFELKFFFHKGVNSFMGEETMSSVNVKQLIKEIVAGEDAEHPFSDSTLTYRLQIKNINIARRTITKYRKELNIPPASKRRKRF